jgi:transposase
MNFTHVHLTEDQRFELENGYRQDSSKSKAFGKRCHLILLKNKGRTNKDIADILDMNVVTVGSWIKHYKAEGLEGLKTKAGRGRKRILDPETDTEKIKDAVKDERQRLSKAKTILETELRKQFSLKTLKRFLKELTADTNGYA